MDSAGKLLRRVQKSMLDVRAKSIWRANFRLRLQMSSGGVWFQAPTLPAWLEVYTLLLVTGKSSPSNIKSVTERWLTVLILKNSWNVWITSNVTEVSLINQTLIKWWKNALHCSSSALCFVLLPSVVYVYEWMAGECVLYHGPVACSIKTFKITFEKWEAKSYY